MNINAISTLSVEALADLVRKGPATSAPDPQADQFPSADPANPELSWAQERLWFLDRLAPSNPFYNLPFCLEISGPLDASALKRALNAIVQRHEPLRSVFPHDRPSRQQVIETLEIAVPQIDFRQLEPEARKLAVADDIRREVSEPFDLSTGPLLRARILTVEDGKHFLVYGFHHIVFDGWSASIFNRQLVAHYLATIGDGTLSSAANVERYADFALWQREAFSGEKLDQEIEFWRARIEDVPPLQLPTDRSRPPVQSFRGKTALFHLDTATRSAVEELARKHAATPFMVMLAAFQIAMGRYAGMDRFLIGSSVAGRTHPSTQEMIGFFINNLILRTDLKNSRSFRSMVEQARSEVLEAIAHQDYPFQQLVERIGGARDLGRNPIYQVSFTYQAPPLEDGSAGPLTLRAVPIEQDATHMDLEVLAWPEPEGICVCTLFAEDLFTKETVQRLLDAFRHVLVAGLKDPETPIARLPLASAEAVRRWAHVPGAAPKPRRDLWLEIVKQAEQQPNKPVLFFEDGRKLSWQELMTEAERLAGVIAAHAPANEPVAVRLQPDLGYIATILAALRLSRPWMPIDPRRPGEAVGEMLESAAPGCLVTSHNLWEQTLWDGPTFFVEDLPSGAPVVAAYRVPDDDDCAFIQFTSGSSGRPKAVEVTYRGFMNRLPWALGTGPMSHDDLGCLKTSPAFVDAVGELLDSLAAGLSLVVPHPDTARSPHDLVALIRRMNITRLMLTPSLADAILTTPGIDSLPLRTLILGGENIRVDLAKRILAALPADAHLVNYYGSTEVSSDAASHRILADDLDGAYAFVPIGRPLPGTEIWLLDENSDPVAPGIPGQIHVAGANLASGYRRQPDLTAEAYRTWQAPDGRSLRLYATGDIATRRADGMLVCLGRRDTQIKIRGIRIEAGEVETRLREYPGVADAALVLHAKGDNASRLVAHVRRDPHAALDAATLRAHLARFFSQSVLPEFILVHDALPMTATGKVDRRRLPPPPDRVTETARPVTQPSSPLQSRLRAFWEEVLGVKGIGVNDSFFDLGGNSLLLAQLHQRLLASIGFQFPLTDLFQYPTIETLAAHLDRSASNSDNAATAGLRADARRQALRRRARRT
ncbi:condensation domain-containing protein [Ensifer sp. YR511]|uniref:non-ribosomal peptide synthetase n=1 Tax=Ensifer sp. YR511 TaxID=1855294 RepID=UPI000881F20A|nr:condensation domain-containing protein [Ensifer sp. YR511]SDN02811.1 amino acid adenylation domain-containing protein [Ensifer sp. YR511]